MFTADVFDCHGVRVTMTGRPPSVVAAILAGATTSGRGPVAVKVAEGTSWVDDVGARTYGALASLDADRIAYTVPLLLHGTTVDAQSQAWHLLAVAGMPTPGAAFMLDVEGWSSPFGSAGGSGPYFATPDMVATMVDVIRAQTGRPPFVYCGQPYDARFGMGAAAKAAHGAPLWWADYRSTPHLPVGYAIAYHQWTDAYPVAALGPFDASRVVRSDLAAVPYAPRPTKGASMFVRSDATASSGTPTMTADGVVHGVATRNDAIFEAMPGGVLRWVPADEWVGYGSTPPPVIVWPADRVAAAPKVATLRVAAD